MSPTQGQIIADDLQDAVSRLQKDAERGHGGNCNICPDETIVQRSDLRALLARLTRSPSEATLTQAAKDWAAAELEPMLDGEGYANPAHFDARTDAARRMIAAYQAMHNTLPNSQEDGR